MEKLNQVELSLKTAFICRPLTHVDNILGNWVELQEDWTQSITPQLGIFRFRPASSSLESSTISCAGGSVHARRSVGLVGLLKNGNATRLD